MSLGTLRVPGSRLPDGSERFFADWNVVEPGFFRTLKLPLIRGRDFTNADAERAPRVAIVNEAFARKVWPDRDAVGQRLLRDSRFESGVTLTVVGVAADAKLVWLQEKVEPYIYVPLAQERMENIALLVRHSAQSSAIPQIRGVLRELNPNLPMTFAMPLTELMGITLLPQRIAASVAGSLGVVGLILAAIGIYGVTAYSVSRRTREIGIRIALGANASNVLKLMVRQGLMLAVIGIIIGLGIGAVASRLIESLLFGIRGLDPLTFGAMALLFAFVSVVATYLPARHATHVDPMVALRNE